MKYVDTCFKPSNLKFSLMAANSFSPMFDHVHVLTDPPGGHEAKMTCFLLQQVGGVAGAPYAVYNTTMTTVLNVSWAHSITYM